MNWDWDKLQEKRQKQGSNPPPRPPQDVDSDDMGQEEETPRARRTPFNNGRGPGGENPFSKIARMRRVAAFAALSANSGARVFRCYGGL